MINSGENNDRVLGACGTCNGPETIFLQFHSVLITLKKLYNKYILVGYLFHTYTRTTLMSHISLTLYVWWAHFSLIPNYICGGCKCRSSPTNVFASIYTTLNLIQAHLSVFSKLLKYYSTIILPWILFNKFYNFLHTWRCYL